jgi:L-aminopeptidase/D-esterase-like protein
MENPVAELTLIGHLATQVMARAVARAIYHAQALPWATAQPAWQDRFGGH